MSTKMALFFYWVIETVMYDLIKNTHPQWHAVLTQALRGMDKQYLAKLTNHTDWLPSLEQMFAAFSQPIDDVRYILLGESPYPRQESANGYAFWDAAVGLIWSPTGLSREVNRATSLRNFIKMLLLAKGDITELSQQAIAKLDKQPYWQTLQQLFTSMTQKGFLLLNASLVYESKHVPYHARQWQPFISRILTELINRNQTIQLLLFGKIANSIPEAPLFTCLIAPHPYNLNFITNPDVQAFFAPLDLLSCHD